MAIAVCVLLTANALRAGSTALDYGERIAAPWAGDFANRVFDSISALTCIVTVVLYLLLGWRLVSALAASRDGGFVDFPQLSSRVLFFIGSLIISGAATDLSASLSLSLLVLHSYGWTLYGVGATAFGLLPELIQILIWAGIGVLLVHEGRRPVSDRTPESIELSLRTTRARALTGAVCAAFIVHALAEAAKHYRDAVGFLAIPHEPFFTYAGRHDLVALVNSLAAPIALTAASVVIAFCLFRAIRNWKCTSTHAGSIVMLGTANKIGWSLVVSALVSVFYMAPYTVHHYFGQQDLTRRYPGLNLYPHGLWLAVLISTLSWAVTGIWLAIGILLIRGSSSNATIVDTLAATGS